MIIIEFLLVTGALAVVGGAVYVGYKMSSYVAKEEE